MLLSPTVRVRRGLSAPGFTVRDYCLSQELPYVERRQPLSRETFLLYADCSHVLSCPMSSRSMSFTPAHRGGFLLRPRRGQIRARRVVVATGSYPSPCARGAAIAAGPAGSHSSACVDILSSAGGVSVSSGRAVCPRDCRVAHEEGVEVELITREAITYTRPSQRPRLLDLVAQARQSAGRDMALLGYYTFPDVFWALPERLRVEKARTFLGPSGEWWLQQRLEGRVPVHGLLGRRCPPGW